LDVARGLREDARDALWFMQLEEREARAGGGGGGACGEGGAWSEA